jgi:hypothetical protein
LHNSEIIFDEKGIVVGAQVAWDVFQEEKSEQGE